METPSLDPEVIATGLPLSIGPGSGGGEDFVQDFVRSSLVGILQPFADQVAELQTQADNLAGQLAAACYDINGNTSRLDQHEQQLATLRADAAQAAEGLDSAKVELASQKREKARLDGNHEMTKAALNTAKSTLGTLTSSVDTLQQQWQERAGKMADFECELVAVEKRVTEQMEGRLNKQGRVCKDLSEQHTDLQQKIQLAKRLSEGATAAVKQLAERCDVRVEGDAVIADGIRERTISLEERLEAMSQLVHRQGEGMQTAAQDLAHLKTWTKQLEYVGTLPAWQAEINASLTSQSSRFEQAEERLMQLQNDSLDERQNQITELTGLEERVGKNLSDIVRWRDEQKAQLDLISSAGERLDGLEATQNGLQDFAASVRQSVDDLASWQQTASRSLKSHDSALKECTFGLEQTSRDVETVGADLRTMRKEVVADREHSQKLGTKLDMCCSYFNGLGKGLQDTQRQIVSGESGLLPSRPLKQPGGTALPAIPRSEAVRPPRTASTGSSTPRASTPRGNVLGAASAISPRRALVA